MPSSSSSFICGCSFPPKDDAESILPSMAQPFKKRHFCRHHSTGTKNKNNNPYSSLGLDTFEALLLDLEEKRKKIYTKNDDGPGGGISLVRFTYSSSTNNLVPIVVKKKTKSDVTNQASSREESKAIIKPCYNYMPGVLMVLLVLVVFFGRTVAIVFMSIGWYIVPALGRDSVEGLDQIRVRLSAGEKKVLVGRIWSRDSRIMEKCPKKLGHLRGLS